MKWLRDRFRGLRRRPPETAPQATDTAEEEPRRAAGPRLMLLVHDAAGRAAYQLHAFEDTALAEAFVQFWFPAGREPGIIAFWAGHDEPPPAEGPDGGTSGELVVLVRDEVRKGLVYPFSYADMEAARPWIAREVARGLGLRQLLVYWANPVRVSRDHWGRVRFDPAQPPAPPAPAEAAEPAPLEERRERDDGGAQEPADEAPPVLEEVDRIVKAVWEDAAAAGPPSAPDEVAEPAPDADAGGDAWEDIRRTTGERRWKQHEGPFRGFGSPRGKF